MNYYPFHIGDYASATRHLSWDEDAAYRRLLDVYYTTEKPLPSDLRAVCRLVLATTDAQRDAVAIVLEEFFDATADGWVNRRADEELTAMREKQQKQRDKANKRWDKVRTEHGTTSAVPQQPMSDATAQKPDATAVPPTPTPTPTPTPVEKREARVPRTALAPKPESVTEAVWNDFGAIRKAKRAPLTDTALAGICDEAAKAGLSIEEALRVCCKQGWQGFDAGWYARLKGGGNGARASPPSKHAATIAALTGRTNPEAYIDVESRTVATDAARIG